MTIAFVLAVTGVVLHNLYGYSAWWLLLALPMVAAFGVAAQHRHTWRRCLAGAVAGPMSSFFFMGSLLLASMQATLLNPGTMASAPPPPAAYGNDPSQQWLGQMNAMPYDPSTFYAGAQYPPGAEGLTSPAGVPITPEQIAPPIREDYAGANPLQAPGTGPVHGVPGTMAGAPPPPAAYDRPYPNVEIISSNDMAYWNKYGLAAVTKPPQVPGGKCYIYHMPIGEFVMSHGTLLMMEQVGYAALIRHEMGHCHGLVHPSSARTKEYASDLWVLLKKPQNPAVPAF
jgi:hypothetical protein